MPTYDIIFLSLHVESDASPRKLKILKAILDVFVDTYNHFGLAKYQYSQKYKTEEFPLSLVNFLIKLLAIPPS